MQKAPIGDIGNAWISDSPPYENARTPQKRIRASEEFSYFCKLKDTT